MIPTSTILDENDRTLKKPEKKLARWQRNFAKVLNVQNGVAENLYQNWITICIGKPRGN